MLFASSPKVIMPPPSTLAMRIGLLPGIWQPRVCEAENTLFRSGENITANSVRQREPVGGQK